MCWSRPRLFPQSVQCASGLRICPLEVGFHVLNVLHKKRVAHGLFPSSLTRLPLELLLLVQFTIQVISPTFSLIVSDLALVENR